MTVQTKRRVVVCVIALMLTLPTERVLLKALSVQTQAQAAQQYAQSLTASQLNAAASAIQNYPVAYRRAIMVALPATLRAAAWQNHLQAYLQANPNLDQRAAQAIQAAIALISPDLLSRAATAAERAEIHTLAGEVSASLGTDAALNLLYNLGPADGTFTSAVPLTEKIADFLRERFLLNAGGASDCDCNSGWGCGGGVSCNGGSGCNAITSWPACGWLWTDPCDGSCNMPAH